MAQFTITITDMGPNSLDVAANSNPPLPQSIIMYSNAQMVGMDILKQLQMASKQINNSAEHRAQMDNLAGTGSLSGKV